MMAVSKEESGDLLAKVSRWALRAGLFVLGGIGAFVTVCAGAAYPLSSILVKPKLKRLSQLRNPRLRRFLIKKGLSFEEVCFSSFDGKKLYGWWVQSSSEKPTIIILHGVRGNRTNMVRFCIALCQANYNVLVFDGRAHGASEGDFVTYGYHECKDVEAAIKFLETEKGVDPEKVGLLGLSMGAAISLQVAAKNKKIKAVWADSPFASLRRVSLEYMSALTHLPETVLKPIAWSTFTVANRRGNFDIDHVEPLKVAPQIDCPVFLVHGAKDELISYRHSQRIYEALNTDKHLWILPDANHTGCFKRGGKDYNQRMINFFQSAFAQ